MRKIPILSALVLGLSIFAVVLFAFNGAPAQARTLAQATGTARASTATVEPTTQATTAAIATTETEAPQTYANLITLDDDRPLLLVLHLYPDGKVELVRDDLDDKPVTTYVGTWSEDSDTVTVELLGDGQATATIPLQLVFSRTDDGLEATEYDESIFGSNGLVLYERDAIERELDAKSNALVTLDLSAGFALDPFIVSVNGGGDINASVLGSECEGYINDNPTVVVNWTGEAEMVHAFTYSDADPTLVIQTPDGTFLCGQNASDVVLDTQIDIANPLAGTFRIWVGSSAPKQLLPTVLVLTTRSDVALSNFRLGDLVQRPPVPPTGAAVPAATKLRVLADEIARFQNATGNELGATPLTQEITTEGTFPAFQVESGDAVCNGYITDAPEYVFSTPSGLAQFTVHFAAKEDSTLVLVGPDGTVHCNDDSAEGSNNNPRITIEEPTQGRYAVFVGRLNQDAALDGTLTVTTAADAAPAVLPPSN